MPFGCNSAFVHVGRAIRTRRLELGLSVREAAARSGIAHTTLGLWERSSYPIGDHAKMASLCSVLDRSPADLLLRGIMGPTTTVTDQIRVLIAQAMLAMTENDLHEMWTTARAVSQRAELLRRTSNPLPTPDTHHVDRIIDPRIHGKAAAPVPPPANPHRRIS